MRVKFLVGTLEDENDLEWRVIYIDEEAITACWIPDLVPSLGWALTVMLGGDRFTLKQEPHLLKYLTKKFKITDFEE